MTKIVCAECGDSDDVVQHVDIAWPGSHSFFLYVHKTDDDSVEIIANPKANGHHVALWLHPECETVHIARLEKAREAVLRAHGHNA